MAAVSGLPRGLLRNFASGKTLGIEVEEGTFMRVLFYPDPAVRFVGQFLTIFSREEIKEAAYAESLSSWQS